MNNNVEVEFNSYHIYVADLENYKLELEVLDNSYELGAINYSETSSKTNKITSVVENKIMNKEKKERYLKCKIRELELKIKKIENAMNVLSDDEKEVMENVYFKRLKNDMTAYKMHVDVTTVYRIKKRALNKMNKYFKCNDFAI